MTQRKIVNLSASLKSKLLNFSRKSNRFFQETLQYYAMERFLYRLSISKYKNLFVLKGGLLIQVWNKATYRATLDIDLLGNTPNSVQNLERIIREICLQPCSDGIEFILSSIKGSTIQINSSYQGVRIDLHSFLDSAKIPLQIDVGFGDPISPNAKPISLPSILDLPSPNLQGYPRETVVAEKFETIVKRGEINSRMKDYYDIWILANLFTFNSVDLSNSIENTFEHRQTELPETIVGLSPKFYENPVRISQWQAFASRKTFPVCTKSLQEIIEEIAPFLFPIIKGILENNVEPMQWSLSKCWVPVGALHETR